MTQPSFEAILWAVSFRIGQLRERHRSMGLDSDVKERSRIEGNIGALEQVQRWMTGKEEMPRFENGKVVGHE